jgi:predicted metalloprotease
VLFVLVGATVAVVAFGVTLILSGDRPISATPPSASSATLEPPSTAAVSSPAPRPTAAPTQRPTATATASRPPTRKPTATASRPPTRKPTPRPSATRPPRTPPTEPRQILVRNPLYDQRITAATCGQRPRPLPTGRRSDERYLNAMMRCLSRVYRGPLEAAGYRLTTPPVLVYTGTVQTPCGAGLKGYPIFYCPANQTIYSSAGSIAEYGETVRLAGYWIAFHEYAHHVQRRIDVLEAAYTRDEDQLRISRRIELQADCFMAMTGIAMRSTGLTADDRAEMAAWRKAVPDEIHGKSASQLYWINRGFGTADFGRCSTWTATKHIS